MTGEERARTNREARTAPREPRLPSCDLYHLLTTPETTQRQS